MANLKPEQINFSLTMLANVDASYFGQGKTHNDIIDDLTAKATEQVNGVFADQQFKDNCGDWGIAWGPAVYAHGDDDTAANVLYVAYNSDTNQFFIGVAGTNPLNWYGWLNEDFATKAADPWDGKVANGHLTQGTQTGLDHLTSIKGDVNLAGMTIKKACNIQFFMGAALLFKTKATVTVGGHSLGGALAPVLGLYLLENVPTVDNGTWSIRSYAGASPGDSAFATYFNTAMKNAGADFLSQINAYDIVPKAWNNLIGLAAIYSGLPAMCICQKPPHKDGPYAGSGKINGKKDNYLITGFEWWAEKLAEADPTISRLGTDTVFNTEASTAGLPLDDCSKKTWDKTDACYEMNKIVGLLWDSRFDVSPHISTGNYLREIFDYTKKHTGHKSASFDEGILLDFMNFLAEAGEQHVLGYMNEFLGQGSTFNTYLSDAIAVNGRSDNPKKKREAVKHLFHAFVENVHKQLTAKTEVSV